MEGLSLFIGLVTLLGMFVGLMAGFDPTLTESTRKNTLRLATISMFVFISCFVVFCLYTVGVL